MKNSNKNECLETNLLLKFQKNFKSQITNKVAMNAVTRSNIQEIALNRDILNNMDYCFSHEIETGAVTAQKQANTCWIFAVLNWFRTFIRKKINVKDFEFSPNYLFFWDKLEKANYFFEEMIALRDRDIDDRELNFLLTNPIPDDGEWHMIINLIKKYGLVPKSVMPNTFNLESSKHLNFILSYKLREGAAKIRKDGRNTEEIRKKKIEFLDEIYRILGIFLGLPPGKFDWSYRDKDKNFHRDTDITPQEFFKKYVGIDLENIHILWSCPSQKTPFYKTYTIQHATYMAGGKELIALNLPIKNLKKYAFKMLKNNEACMFGCDALQESFAKEGLLYSGVYEYDKLLQTKFNMDKGMRYDFVQSRMNHLMVLTGVDVVRNKSVKWKVENSWGEDYGKKGYFIMSDEWFEEHAFEVIVPGEYLSAEDLQFFKEKPVILPRWFGMI